MTVALLLVTGGMFVAPSKITVPGLSPNWTAQIVQRRLTRPTIAGEELALFRDGKEYPCRKVSSLAGHVSLNQPSMTLQFCRFVTGSDSRFFLGESLLEIVPKGNAGKVCFRFAFDQRSWTSGWEGIVSDPDFKRLKIRNPRVSKNLTGWSVVRTCLAENPTGFFVEEVEEHVSIQGDYHRRVLNRRSAPASVDWSLNMQQ